MSLSFNRRHFIGSTAAAFAALAASGCHARTIKQAVGYGPLVTDPAGLLDLPAGFSYRVLSALGSRWTMAAGCPMRLTEWAASPCRAANWR